jgi:hypothetical protein
VIEMVTHTAGPIRLSAELMEHPDFDLMGWLGRRAGLDLSNYDYDPTIQIFRLDELYRKWRQVGFIVSWKTEIEE